jgi:hypothetical protein
MKVLYTLSLSQSYIFIWRIHYRIILDNEKLIYYGIIQTHLIYSSSKRGVDFGLARGFSGSQALKHSLGLLASQHPGGPGRRKRTSSPSFGTIEE